MTRIFQIHFIVIAVIVMSACTDNTSSVPVDKAANAVSSVSAAGGKEMTTRIESITFIGQKDACDCTRDRIEESWQALQNVMKGGPEIPVERLQLDVATPEVERLTKARPLMVAPGIYFLDEKKQITELLQGEVDEQQIAQVLQ